MFGKLDHPIVGVQNESPQDMPLWYEDYFELKALETLWAQEKLCPYNYLEEFELGAHNIIKDNFF